MIEYLYMDQPLVSIIITCYNYGSYVGEAIESALSQSYKNIELIVIDDGSTDNSDTTIASYVRKHPTIQYAKQNNKGVVATRNHGLALAKGEYFLFLDADDKLPANYVKLIVDEAQKRKLDVVYTDYERFGAENSVSRFPDFSLDTIKAGNIVHISALVRRDIASRHVFDKNLDKLSHEDWDFFLGIAMSGGVFGKSSQTKLLYRAHGNSRNLDLSINEEASYPLRHLKAYVYIIEKYKKKYPGKIDYSNNSSVVSWWYEAEDRLNLVKGQEKLLSQKNQEIELLKNEIDSIKQSKSYLIGRTATSPFRALKKLLHVKKS